MFYDIIDIIFNIVILLQNVTVYIKKNNITKKIFFDYMFV